VRHDERAKEWSGDTRDGPSAAGRAQRSAAFVRRINNSEQNKRKRGNGSRSDALDGAFTIGWSTFAFASGRLVHRIGERLPSVIGIVVHILGLLFFMVAFEHGLAWVIAAALIAGAGMGLLSPALTVVVQNSVPVARMGSATTSQQFIRQIGAALGVSAFVLAATVGGFRLGLLLMIAVSAGTFACVLALPAHSLHDAHHVDALE
jgi:MFS family permease